MSLVKVLRTVSLAPIAVMAAVAVCTSAVQAQTTVVTPTSLNGWFLYDGKPGTPPSPAQITGAMPFDGNGSLQLTATNGTQQPAAFFGLASPVPLSSLTDLGFSYSAATGEVAAPTLRLFVSGISGSTHTTGSFGWYGSTGTSGFTTPSLGIDDGEFFFRLTGAGQVDNACDNTGFTQTFDDRRLLLDDWTRVCNGETGKLGLADAMITGIEVDYGSFPGITSPTTVYADEVHFGFSGGTPSTYNFEVNSPTSTVPEPASMTLLGLGLVALVGARGRTRAR